ncbi:MAG TPA: DNA recombination protein RmuC [Xanthobacteraceae bacterium]|nr:DNA recombination protein RmuC [Xanthobacteraceae bacterium]
MDLLLFLAVVCLAIGAGIGFFLGKAWQRREVTQLSGVLETERQLNLERLSSMKDTFVALASDALQKNNSQFLALANETLQKRQEAAARDLQEREKAIKELIGPVKESLDRFDQKIQDVEKARIGAYEGLTTQVRSLFDSQQQLRAETNNLVNALKSPRIRGRWGEIQLRRVVELAGMIGHCDFTEQQSANTEDGRLRPDLVVRLPGDKFVVIDAKSPLDAYLLALDAVDENSRNGHLATYANQIRKHIGALSNKTYWEQFKSAPDFVFMFLPGESFYSAALEADPSLIEAGVNQRVILATPTTLIALLKAIAYGWRQERLGEEVERIGNLGKELYERVRTLGAHFASVGSSLQKAVEKYNEAVGTLESRVLVSARRFKEMPITATDKEIELARQIETIPRQLQSSDLNGHGEQPFLFNPVQDSGQAGAEPNRPAE